MGGESGHFLEGKILFWAGEASGPDQSISHNLAEFYFDAMVRFGKHFSIFENACVTVIYKLYKSSKYINSLLIIA